MIVVLASAFLVVVHKVAQAKCAQPSTNRAEANTLSSLEKSSRDGSSN